MKRCPFCGEDLQDVAVRCPHCGRELTAAAERAEQLRRARGVDSTGALVTLFVMIPALILLAWLLL